MAAMSPSKASLDPSPAPHGPIPTLPNQPALAVRIAHPVLIAVLLMSSFRSLVTDPTATMCVTLPITSAIQVLYVVTCLPPAGTRLRLSKNPTPRKTKPWPNRTSRNQAAPSIILVRVLFILPTTFATASILTGYPSLADSDTGPCHVLPRRSGAASVPCPLWRALPRTYPAHFPPRRACLPPCPVSGSIHIRR